MSGYFRKAVLVFLIIFFLSCVIAFAQNVTENSTAEAQTQRPPKEIVEPEDNATSALEGASPKEEREYNEWVWGEVVSTDKAANKVIVKYVDYETDAEKQAVFTLDSKTNLENVKSLDEISAGDSITIDYSVDKDGKNIAQNMSIEKKEPLEESPGIKNNTTIENNTTGANSQ